MIQPGSVLEVVDNSNVSSVRCLRVYGRRPRKRGFGAQGDVFVGSVVGLRKSKGFSFGVRRFKRGDLVRCLILFTKKVFVDSSGFCKSSPSGNSCILLGSNFVDPLGSRVQRPLSIVLREKGFVKVFGLCKRIFLFLLWIGFIFIFLIFVFLIF